MVTKPQRDEPGHLRTSLLYARHVVKLNARLPKLSKICDLEFGDTGASGLGQRGSCHQNATRA